MAEQYTITSNAAAASAAIKVAILVVTGSTIDNVIFAWDVSFNGTSATATPILVEWVSYATASSAGSTYTPNKVGPNQGRASTTTARINDTTDGGTPVVLAGWYVPPTSGLSMAYPLGRELSMTVSKIYGLRLTTVAGSGTPNYQANVWFEE